MMLLHLPELPLYLPSLSYPSLVGGALFQFHPYLFVLIFLPCPITVQMDGRIYPLLSQECVVLSIIVTRSAGGGHYRPAQQGRQPRYNKRPVESSINLLASSSLLLTNKRVLLALTIPLLRGVGRPHHPFAYPPPSPRVEREGVADRWESVAKVPASCYTFYDLKTEAKPLCAY